MSALLYEVAPVDPITYVVVAAGLLAVALLASYISARRAAGVEPMEALRIELFPEGREILGESPHLEKMTSGVTAISDLETRYAGMSPCWSKGTT